LTNLEILEENVKRQAITSSRRQDWGSLPQGAAVGNHTLKKVKTESLFLYNFNKTFNLLDKGLKPFIIK